MIRTSLIVVLAVAAAGCTSWWPFGGAKGEQPRWPSDATLYQCDGNKELVVRYIDGGKSAIVMFPDRDFRLDQVVSGSGARYSNGRTTLFTKEAEAFLEENGQTLLANCKTTSR